MTSAHAEDLCEALDLAIASLDGAPSMILCNSKMYTKLNAAARMLNFNERIVDAFGNSVSTYNGTPIVDMKQYYNGTNTVDVIPTRTAAEYRVQTVTSSTFKTDGSFAASADGYLYTESSGTYTKVSSGSYGSSTTYYILVGAANTTEIYVVRLGLDGFHAVTPQGGVGLNVILGIFEIVIHCKARVTTVVLCCLRLLCIVDYEELIRTVLCCKFNTFRAKCILNPKLGSIWMSAALKDCCSANFEGCS